LLYLRVYNVYKASFEKDLAQSRVRRHHFGVTCLAVPILLLCSMVWPCMNQYNDGVSTPHLTVYHVAALARLREDYELIIEIYTWQQQIAIKNSFTKKRKID